MTRRLEDRLADIAGAIEAIEGMVGRDPAEAAVTVALENPILFRAVKNAMAEIGEAIKSLPPELRQRHPHIDWRGATAMRDVVVHQYFRADRSVIVATIIEDLPGLRDAVAAEQARLAGGA